MPFWKKSLIALAGFLLTVLGVRTLMPESVTSSYPVDRVIDGDTIVVIKDAETLRVRLLGIDAPEKGECYYNESREYLTKLLDSGEVRLEKDISGSDQYGRLLRYVLIEKNDDEDDILVNQLLLSEGYAQTDVTPPDNRYRDLFSSAQESALREEKGLWGACEYEREDEATRERDDAVPPSPECTIKGNISEKGFGKTYLIPGCDNYNRVKIDSRKGEQYFCHEGEAVEAGFRKATNCP